jgi:choline kinase
MEAIILAAGYGRRMQPLSNECHKALLPVGGSTILGRIMDGLRTVEVSDVTVVTGYRAHDVEHFLKNLVPETCL